MSRHVDKAQATIGESYSFPTTFFEPRQKPYQPVIFRLPAMATACMLDHMACLTKNAIPCAPQEAPLGCGFPLGSKHRLAHRFTQFAHRIQPHETGVALQVLGYHLETERGVEGKRDGIVLVDVECDLVWVAVFDSDMD